MYDFSNIRGAKVLVFEKSYTNIENLGYLLPHFVKWGF
jgi:hypothetical protein